MIRMMTAVVGTAVAMAMLASPVAQAQPVSAQTTLQNKSGPQASTDLSAQRRLRRVYIYPHAQGHWQPDVAPRYNPGPNAVRVCNAAYVQEARPSGTVIVPHMSCTWRRG